PSARLVLLAWDVRPLVQFLSKGNRTTKVLPEPRAISAADARSPVHCGSESFSCLQHSYMCSTCQCHRRPSRAPPSRGEIASASDAIMTTLSPTGPVRHT